MTENQRIILKQQAKSRITTSFIFPLSKFEAQFGDLWGHFKEDQSHLTEEEMRWRRIWRRIRKEILDNGNDQVRSLEEEIDEIF